MFEKKDENDRGQKWKKIFLIEKQIAEIKSFLTNWQIAEMKMIYYNEALKQRIHQQWAGIRNENEAVSYTCFSSVVFHRLTVFFIFVFSVHFWWRIFMFVWFSEYFSTDFPTILFVEFFGDAWFKKTILKSCHQCGNHCGGGLWAWLLRLPLIILEKINNMAKTTLSSARFSF